MHVRKGDQVVVIAGKEKGKRGRVLRLLTDKGRVVIERINIRDAIYEHVRDSKSDLVVLGTYGRGGIERLLFGSVAEAVARQASCSVLLVTRAASVARAAEPPAAPDAAPGAGPE